MSNRFDSRDGSHLYKEVMRGAQWTLVRIQALALGCLIAGCGGGSSSSTPPISVKYKVGGSLSGLAAGESLVLQDNGGTSTTVSANGSFALSDTLSSGDSYMVTVLTPPAGKRCFIANQSGVIASSDVSNLTVSCGSPQLALLAGVIGGAGNADGTASTARFNLRFAITDVAHLDGYRNAFGQGGAAVDNQGNVFVADAGNHTVRKIDSAGAVTTVAGKAGVAGSADGAAAEARFRSPTSIAFDHNGNAYVADTGNNIIRKISADGVVSTFAGSPGIEGSSDGPGATARFRLAFEHVPVTGLDAWPACRGAVAVDGNDNVYVADCANSTIRMITPAGTVSTLAGTAGVVGSNDGTGAAATFGAPVALAVDAMGNVYVADSPAYPPAAASGYTVRMITPAAVVTTIAGTGGMYGSTDGTGAAARFGLPYGITVDASGIYVADGYYNTIRKIAPGGVVNTLAGTAGQSGSADGNGSDARFNVPSGMASDGNGKIYVLDAGNNTIRTITSAGAVTTLAGAPAVTGSADGAGSAARFAAPIGITADGSGNILVADSNNNVIRKITPTGTVTTFAGTAGQHGSTDGSAATFFDPTGVTTDGAGNIYVADSFSQTIRKITPTGVVSTLAGNPAFNAPQGTTAPSLGGSDDGTGSSATFRLSAIPFPSPTSLQVPYCHGAVATDRNGNVYVADCGNDTIRKVTAAGVVTTLAGTPGMADSTDGTGSAARFRNPSGIATDASGNIYIADAGNNLIRKVTAAGVVTTLAGTAGVAGSADGAGAAASFDDPQSLTVDELGNVYVADTGNSTIRKITPSGTVTTVLGTAGSVGFSPGDLPGVLSSPVGVAFSGGMLYVATDNGVAVATYIP